MLPSEPMEPTEPKNKTKIILIAVIIASLILVVLVTAFFVIKKFKNINTEQQGKEKNELSQKEQLKREAEIIESVTAPAGAGQATAEEVLKSVTAPAQ